MTKVVLYDPSISSPNMGDHVIVDAALRHLSPLLDGAYRIHFSTHVPISYLYTRITKDADRKFVLGTNLLRGRMNRPFRQWDIHLGNAKGVGPVTLMGVGWWQYGDELNRYTKLLYRTVLSPDHTHSVRDSYTERQLLAAGVRDVINTGCPTLWDLTPEHCARIPSGKGSHVVTTVTDYHRDATNDRLMLEYLSNTYETVTLWLQGYHDQEYVVPLIAGLANVRLADPSLAALDASLAREDVDFVGTRLHAGVRALQHGRRTIILSIDNRAKEMSRDFGLPVVPRGDLNALRDRTESPFETRITLPQDAIDEWKRRNGIALTA